MNRYSAIAVLAATALLLVGCSAGGSADEPLVVGVVQKGVQACAEAPNLAPSVKVAAWNSPIGWAFDWYYNQSTLPVEIESVSLIDSHNLMLHKAIVYEMRYSEHPLVQVDGWSLIDTNADPSAWAQRQRVPGAVIPPQSSAVGIPGPRARDVYEVVLNISAKSPAGGYAIGQQVTYRQGSAQYMIRSYTGYAIGPPTPEGPRCQAQKDAITAAWQNG